MSEHDQLLESIAGLTHQLSALTTMIGALVESNARIIELVLNDEVEGDDQQPLSYLDGTRVL